MILFLFSACRRMYIHEAKRGGGRGDRRSISTVGRTVASVPHSSGCKMTSDIHDPSTCLDSGPPLIAPLHQLILSCDWCTILQQSQPRPPAQKEQGVGGVVARDRWLWGLAYSSWKATADPDPFRKEQEYQLVGVRASTFPPSLWVLCHMCQLPSTP